MFILRILLIWWLATVIMRWASKSSDTRPENRPHDPAEAQPVIPPDLVHNGDIEDADFEELERQ